VSISIRLPATAIVVCFISNSSEAQAGYRDLEGGRPVRVSDATPTERHALDLDLTTVRVDKLSRGRYRLQVEPRVSYGILPRMDVSLRALAFYREPSAVPRGTVAGLGVGGEYLVKMESLRSPAFAVAGEVFLPTGPSSSRAAYSGKVMMSRSFPAGRLHLNGSYGTFSVYVPPPPPGNPPLAPPIIDGPCSVSPAGETMRLHLSCATPAPISVSASSAVLKPGTNTSTHWLVATGVDKSFPLRSVLIVADVFAERYEGVGRPTDWTAELGGRKQLTPRLVADLGVGRHFRGVSQSWFATFGTTLSIAVGL
jgi:hypothetical protein